VGAYHFTLKVPDNQNRSLYSEMVFLPQISSEPVTASQLSPHSRRNSPSFRKSECAIAKVAPNRHRREFYQNTLITVQLNQRTKQMKNLIQRSLTALGTAAFLSIGAFSPAEAAYRFDETPVNQNDVVAVAQPLNQGYKLLIFEQQSNARACWSESGYSPVAVEPLLLNFNFSGICGRATDSNGYSVRVNDNDLALTHNLSLQNVGGEVRLYAVSSGEKILIGRTGGLTNGFMKIKLEPGWRFTKRTYNGKVLGHFYLSNDNYIASSQPTYEQPAPPPVSTKPAPAPSRPLPPPPPPVASQPGRPTPPPAPPAPRNETPSQSPDAIDRSDMQAWKRYIEMLLRGR
jgi:N-acetylmuramoyl-L-alanine amidase